MARSNSFARIGRLLRAQVRMAALLGLQYRFDFLLEAAVEAVWTATAIVPLWLVYAQGGTLAGYTFMQGLVVIGYFTLLQGLMDGIIGPSLTDVVERVRTGTFDFVLLKPYDVQLLVSFARMQPWKGMNIVSGIGILLFAFLHLGDRPTGLAVTLSIGLFLLGAILVYSFWILAISASFFLVKVDNLSFLFTSVFDAARWPRQAFRGVLRALFTYVIPLGLMTGVPADALLGKLQRGDIATAIGLTLVFFALSRFALLRSVRKYSSASS